MWVLQWEFQVTMSILKEPCKYRILRLGSMMNVFKIMNYLGVGICPTSLQSWKGFQSPIPFMSKTPPGPLSQTRTWCGCLKYAMEGKIKWTFNLLVFYLLASWNSWKVNEGILALLWNGMFTKTFQTKWMSSNQLSKTTLGIRAKHLHGINLFNFLNSYTKYVIIYVLSVFWCRY
jgi:hypothetical protein